MFKNVVVKPIFPTNLWIYDLEPEIAEPLNRRLFQEPDALDTVGPRNNFGSHRPQRR